MGVVRLGRPMCGRYLYGTVTTASRGARGENPIWIKSFRNASCTLECGETRSMTERTDTETTHPADIVRARS